ncbi:hypothetical protein ACNOYE_03550 [Nannocystaceae bacterium ST9]
MSRSPRRIGAIVSMLMMTVTVGCAQRPSEDRCRAMVDHVVELMRASHEGRASEIAGAVAEERRQALLDRCLIEGTAAEVECVLEASELAEIQGCAPRR